MSPDQKGGSGILKKVFVFSELVQLSLPLLGDIIGFLNFSVKKNKRTS